MKTYPISLIEFANLYQSSKDVDKAYEEYLEYSRKHMIEFANFAKSYQSSKKVEEAYEAYLKGDRVVNHNSTYSKFRRANVVYINGLTVKDRYQNEDIPYFPVTRDFSMYVIESWDEIDGVLKLKSKKK